MSLRKDNWPMALNFACQIGDEVTSTEATLFRLLRQAGTEEFKALSKLVR